MSIWTGWLDILSSLIESLAAFGGLGTGLAIVLATLLLRFALLPIAAPISYRARVRQKKLSKLQPELHGLRERFKERPDRYMKETLELYRKHDLTPFDIRALAGALLQLPIFLGMFHALRDGIASDRFMWISNLARPDGLLAIAAGVTTALMIAVVPDMPEHVRTFMLLLPSVLVAVMAFKFSAALCVYWITSNSFTTLQTLCVNRLVDRHIRLGRISV